MPLSITRFRDKIGENKTVAPINRFEVIITNGLDPSYNTENLKFFCELAELPGRNLLTTEEKIYGPIRKIAYGSSYLETSMTFLCTSNGMMEKRYFDNWMDNINHPTNFDANYYNNYIKDITLNMYDETNLIMYSVLFKECYPTIVGAISLNTAAKDDYARINVTFTYRYWIRNSDQATNIDTPMNTEFEMQTSNL